MLHILYWLPRLIILAMTAVAGAYTPMVTPLPTPEPAPRQQSVLLDVQPPSTLLPVGATTVTVTVVTSQADQCAWNVGAARPFTAMTPFAVTGALTHTTVVTGLNPDPNVLNQVNVRCAGAPDQLVTRIYRSLSAANPRFPRTGNLWGWWHFADKGLPYMARIDLWLGAEGMSAEQIVALRTLNPHVRVLPSINAVENDDLSQAACNGCQGEACDAWYLHDVNGNPIEVWPGSYRINLTLPAVAEYQACYAYLAWLNSGYQADGIFFDNVMTTQSWLRADIYGNPVEIDANRDGIADDPDALDAAWRAGVLHEIETFRRFMPHAIVSSHSTDIDEPGIAELFNGFSMGFWTADVLEGEKGFAAVFDRYRAWIARAVAPPTTMIESSPVDDIAYGYDYAPLDKIPASTLEFAASYYPWMRFGLAFTLMDDGYFAHEFGDTWHGNDWWYDELDFDLGYPLGPAQRIPVAGFDPGPNQIENSGFETPVVEPWEFWADDDSGCAATFQQDAAANAPQGNKAVRIDVTATCGDDWRIELAQHDRSLVTGVSYDLTFWARSAVTRTLGLSSQKGSPEWDNYGLADAVVIGPAWREYTVTFTANATVNDARIQFFLGAAAGAVWLDDVRLTLHPPDIFRREYTAGIVLLNGSLAPQTVDVEPGFRRLTGQQAPRFETIVDDADPNFGVASGVWTQTHYDSGEWKATGPFYHDWGDGLHELTGAAGVATWTLPIAATDIYTVTVWWPAAPAASRWNAAALYEIVADGKVVASRTLDQRTGGDQWHLVGTTPLAPDDHAFVRLRCTGAPCVADALHLRSRARYNDGAPVTTVDLAPLDGIILQRIDASAPGVYLPVMVR